MCSVEILERVELVLSVEHGDQQLLVVLWKANGVEIAANDVWSVLGHRVDHLLLGSHEEAVSEVELCVQHLPLTHCRVWWIRLDLLALEVSSHLLRDLLEDLLGEEALVVLEVVEGHELDHVARLVLAMERRVERLLVSIELLHGAEVSIANAYDDHRQWQVRGCHQLIDGLLHVHDGTICQNQQNVVLLVVL